MEVFKNLSTDDCKNLCLISKWGCDGSAQNQYNQKFDSETSNDGSLFLSSFVPIQLYVKTPTNKRIVWQNPRPCSPRYCRPIRFRFIKETTEVTKAEFNHINNQIESLLPSTSLKNHNKLIIKHLLVFTMVDGKVCNSLTDTTSTQRCYVCVATSKDFNNLSKVIEYPTNEENYKFGISILHARIRFFESLLHLAYKVPIGKWQTRDAVEKAVVQETKKKIQVQFRKECGMIVDVPKSGFGNTNTGNLSRRFFENPEISSRITGVNAELIKRYKVILETISSGHKINTKLFKSYTLETAKLYVQLYGWYPMPPTIHKVLVHGTSIIDHALLPIGQLSEEAAESRNKHFKRFRENFSRKISRKASNVDVFNRLILTSDPVLTAMSPLPAINRKCFSKETIEMLLPDAESDVPENLEFSDEDPHFTFDY